MGARVETHSVGSEVAGAKVGVRVWQHVHGHLLRTSASVSHLGCNVGQMICWSGSEHVGDDVGIPVVGDDVVGARLGAAVPQHVLEHMRRVSGSV